MRTVCDDSHLRIGVLFICFNVDYRILWGELTDEVVNDGFQFYTTFFNAPPAIKVSTQPKVSNLRSEIVTAHLCLLLL